MMSQRKFIFLLSALLRVPPRPHSCERIAKNDVSLLASGKQRPAELAHTSRSGSLSSR
jgi:hypothetical protein